MFEEPLDQTDDEQHELAMDSWGRDVKTDEVIPPAHQTAKATEQKQKRLWSGTLYRFLTNRKTETDFLIDDE